MPRFGMLGVQDDTERSTAELNGAAAVVRREVLLFHHNPDL